MGFPSLEKMVEFGVFTISQLVKYDEGELRPRKIRPLNECDTCAFVYEGVSCNNCHAGLMIRPSADPRSV